MLLVVFALVPVQSTFGHKQFIACRALVRFVVSMSSLVNHEAPALRKLLPTFRAAVRPRLCQLLVVCKLFLLGHQRVSC